MAALVDTSLVVAIERGDVPAGVLEDLAVREEVVAISVITAAELLHGVERSSGSRRRRRSAFVEALLGALDPIPITMPVARSYAHLSAGLSRRGVAVDANDLWIAATAIAEDMGVATRNGDFARIPGVRLAVV